MLTSHVLRAVLYGVSPTDPLAFTGAVVLLLGSALLAVAGPVGRIARVDPAVVLKQE